MKHINAVKIKNKDADCDDVAARRRASTTYFGRVKPGVPLLQVRFGNVLVEAVAPSKSELKRNVDAGRAALLRAGRALTRPGVKLKLDSKVPLYHADPARPGYLIQKLNGQQRTGTIVDAKFKAVRVAQNSSLIVKRAI
jgi:hypothetical protein